MSLLVADSAVVRPNSSGSWRDKLLPNVSSNDDTPSASNRGSSSPASSVDKMIPARQPAKLLNVEDDKAVDGDASTDGYESDWEREVSDMGEVFYVVPFTRTEMRRTAEGVGENDQNAAADESSNVRQNQRKKTGKLSRLIRRRESKRDRNAPATSTVKARKAKAPLVGNGKHGDSTHASQTHLLHNESSDNDSSTYYGQLRTFESVFEGHGDQVEMTEVTLRIKGRKALPAGYKTAADSSLLQMMVGIVPVRNSQTDADPHLSNVVVSHLVEGGPALKQSDKIKSGDIIRLVDGQQVNLATVEQLLSTYNSSSVKVKLTLQRPILSSAVSVSTPLKLTDSSSSGQEEVSAITSAADEDESIFGSGDDTTPSSLFVSTPPRLAKLLLGEAADSHTADMNASKDVKSFLRRMPYLVLGMTRHNISEASPEKADVLYQFPAESAGPLSDSLLKTRGMLVTLCQILPEMSGKDKDATDSNTPFVTSLSVSGALVHCGVVSQGETLLLIALPAAKCGSSARTAGLVAATSRILCLKHGSLRRAFSAQDSTKSWLDELFGGILLEELLDVRTVEQDPHPLLDLSALLSRNPVQFEDSQPASHWLNLPDDVRFQIEDAMNQFESGDFQDFSEEMYCLPREFNILGSCVFHRGLLLANHLPKDDMLDVFLWCKSKKLLCLTHTIPVHQIVSWTEIFLTDQRMMQVEKDAVETNAPNGGAHGSHLLSEEQRRTFLLVVGSGYQIMGTLLETGFGACSAALTEGPSFVRPDPFYVDHALNTLDHLEEMGIPLVCERWLTLPNNPAIVSVDHLYQLGNKAEAEKLPEKGIVLRRTKTIEYSSSSSSSSTAASISSSEDRVLRRKRQEGDECSLRSEEMKTAFREDSGAGDQTHMEAKVENEESVWDVHRDRQRTRMNYSEHQGVTSFKSASPCPSSVDEEFVTYQVSQLTLSPENTLFHFLHLDAGEAVFVAPLKQTPNGSPGPSLHEELLDNFRAACQLIHTTFESSRTARTALACSASGAAQRRPNWMSRSGLAAVKEQGMLFQWSPISSSPPSGGGKAAPSSKRLPLLSYWVCGRMFEDGVDFKECYVCYHDSAPQTLVELAFRLTYGMCL